MMRRSAFLFGGLLLIHTSQVAGAPMPILVSGQATIAILDGNGDGPGSPPDCGFSATFDPVNDALVVTGMQDVNNPMQGCSGMFMGTATEGSDSSSAFINMVFNASTAVGTVLLPTVIQAIDGSPDGDPLELDELSIEFGDGGGNAGGILCTVGAPVALVSTTDGTRVLVPLTFFPSRDMPQFLKIANLPVSSIFGDTLKIDGYIPITTDRRITVEVGAETILDTDLDELAPCPGGVGVPTATQWGLIGLVVGLLLLGTWAVARRPGFAEALPR